MRTMILLLVGLLVVTVVVLWISLKDFPRVVRSLRCGVRVKGYVARDDITRAPNFVSIHLPVVIFRDHAGVAHEVKTRHHKKTSAREQMAEVEIAYLPAAPAKTAVLVGLRFYWASLSLPLFFLLFAGGFVYWLVRETPIW